MESKTRPKVGYRLPLNQEGRRKKILELSDDAIRLLDEALEILAEESPRAANRINKSIRLIADVRIKAIEMAIGPEPQNEANNE